MWNAVWLLLGPIPTGARIPAASVLGLSGTSPFSRISLHFNKSESLNVYLHALYFFLLVVLTT